MITPRPSYIDMVKEAIDAAGKPGKGSSRQAIKKYLQSQYGLDVESKTVKSHIAAAIKKGCESAQFEMPDGLSGKVKISKTAGNGKITVVKAASEAFDAPPIAKVRKNDGTSKTKRSARSARPAPGSDDSEDEPSELSSRDGSSGSESEEEAATKPIRSAKAKSSQKKTKAKLGGKRTSSTSASLKAVTTHVKDKKRAKKAASGTKSK